MDSFKAVSTLVQFALRTWLLCRVLRKWLRETEVTRQWLLDTLLLVVVSI